MTSNTSKTFLLGSCLRDTRHLCINGKKDRCRSQHFSKEERKVTRSLSTYNGRKGLKAQAEIVIVLAAIILVVTLVTLVFQTGLTRPDITNLASVFRDELNRKLYDGSFGVVKAVSQQGGFLEPSTSNTDFVGSKVAYWQICQNKGVPSLADIRKNIKVGVERFISNLKLNDFQGKRVRLELKESDVIIRNQDILVTLTLDTNLAGYDLDSFYEIRIPANLAEVYNFASDFVTDNAANRHFERFLVSLFFKTNEKILPTSGVLTKCGEVIFRTWDDIKDAVGKTRDYAFVNTLFWQQGSDEFKYYIPAVNGKKYENLKINFFGGDITRSNLQSSKNPISIINTKVFTVITPYCVKDYEVGYSLNSPVVVKVSGTSDYSFNFAVLPLIDNNKIGRCGVQESFLSGEDICSQQARCEIKLSVTDQQNRPIPDTEVTFGSCSVGKSDVSGQVKGKVPCGISELNVYNPEYVYFNDIVSSKQVPENITLRKINPINVHFYRGDTQTKMVVKDSTVKSHKIIKIATKQILGDYIFTTFKSKTKSSWAQKEFVITNTVQNKSTVTSQIIDFLPPDIYTVEIATQKKGQIKYLDCDTGIGGTGIAMDCDAEYVDTIFISKVDYDFILEEGVQDLYITALTPMASVSDGQIEWDYTPFIKDASVCLQPVSTNKPPGVCNL